MIKEVERMEQKKIKHKLKSGILTIYTNNAFTFEDHDQFLKIYRQPDVSKIVLNMKDTDYIDSSAMGIMIMIKEYTTKKGIEVKVVKVQKFVKKILTVANFQKLFDIS